MKQKLLIDLFTVVAFAVFVLGIAFFVYLCDLVSIQFQLGNVERAVQLGYFGEGVLVLLGMFLISLMLVRQSAVDNLARKGT